MSLELRKFSELTINFDKERIPLSSSERESKKGKYPYYGAQGIIDYVDEYIFDGEYLLIAEDGENLNSRSQPIANVVLGKFWVNNHAHIVKTNSKCEIHYLCYLLNNINISGYITGSAQPKLNQYNLNNMVLEIQDYETQYKISIILKRINDKIKLNEKINKNLYNIIEARFKHYVKDFSNLDKVVLSDYCNDIIRGFNSKYVEKSNLINLNQKVNKGDILEKQYFKYLNDNIEVPKEKFAKRKDVLLNSLGDGTLGRVHYYNENTDNVIIDQHITIIRSDENKLPSSYIYQYLKCGAGQYHLNSLISGSTGMLMLNISHIRNLELPILPQKELFEFDNFAKDLFDKISSNTKEIEKLQKLRDTLLPKLMSGEIDVSKINCDLELKYNYMKYLFNQIHTPMSKSVV